MNFTTGEPWTLAALPGESREALRDRRDRAYFEWQIADNGEFWRRLGQSDLDVTGARVLELGCGFGALAVDLARRGARAVIATDLDCDRVGFARRHVPQAYPALAPALRFQCQDIGDIKDDASFDVVVCKDTVEHILDLQGVFRSVHRLLKPGGRFVIGTSPLYFSPFGDHGRYLGPGIPWLGALAPEPLLFRLASRKQKAEIRSAADVGLNKMTPARFRSLLAPPDWRMESIRYNAGDKRLLAALSVFRRIRPVEKYFTVSIYAVIRRQ